MNAKKCKGLRRLAEAATIGLPYRVHETSTTRGKVYQYGTDPMTRMPLYAKRNDTVTLGVCTRAVYQGAKHGSGVLA